LSSETTRNSQADPHATKRHQAERRDEALWLIVTIRLLQLLSIGVLWLCGTWLIKALGF
jgi:hypothetical protein